MKYLFFVIFVILSCKLYSNCTGIICSETIFMEACDINQAPPFTNFAAFLDNGGSISGSCSFDTQSFSMIDEQYTTISCGYDYLRTYQISDSNNASYECQHTIILEDYTSPELPCYPFSITLECDQSSQSIADAWNEGNIADLLLCAEDCGEVTISSDYYFGGLVYDCGNTGTLYVNYIAADACGNITSAEATLNIVDLFPPNITCKDNIVNASIEDIPPYTDVTDFLGGGNLVFDHCGLDSTSFIMSNENNLSSCPMQVVRTYEISDQCQNRSNCTQTITYCENTTSLIYVSECANYTSPSGNNIWDQSGVYFDTIPNASCCDSLMTILLTIEDNLVESPYDDMPNSLRLNLACAEYLDVITISPTIDTLFLDNSLLISNHITIKGNPTNKPVLHFDFMEGNLPTSSHGLRIGNGVNLVLENVIISQSNNTSDIDLILNNGILNFVNTDVMGENLPKIKNEGNTSLLNIQGNTVVKTKE